MVPQLIPRDPVTTAGVKMPANLIRTTVQDSETINIEMDPTRNAPIAVLDGLSFHLHRFFPFDAFVFLECDTHLTTNAKGNRTDKKDDLPHPQFSV